MLKTKAAWWALGVACGGLVVYLLWRRRDKVMFAAKPPEATPAPPQQLAGVYNYVQPKRLPI